MSNLVGTKVYDKVNDCEATVVHVGSQCGSAVLKLQDEKGTWAQWPRNVEEAEEVKEPQKYYWESMAADDPEAGTSEFVTVEQVIEWLPWAEAYRFELDEGTFELELYLDLWRIRVRAV